MLKGLIAIVFVLIGVSIFMWIVGFYDRTARPHGSSESYTPPAAVVAPPVAANPSDSFPGLPPALEAPLKAAQEQGVEELGKWLKQFGRQVQDPRLAAIELDYVVLLNLKNHKAARERFIQVASRIQPGSPIFERVRKLAPAYDEQ